MNYKNSDLVLEKIKGYFKITELVASDVVSRYGEDMAWSFLDPRLLANLLFIRINRGNSITVNNGINHQRGLRHNTSKIVSKKTIAGKMYLSGHTLGMAVDFSENKDHATTIRKWIVDNSENLPYPCRLENLMNGSPISWVHMDVMYKKDAVKVYLFNV